MIRKDDTICAPATSPGGAIAIIRLSGAASIEICKRIFFPSDPVLNLLQQKGNTIIHGTIREGSSIIDEVLVAIFRSPHSYTGEDSVEISCHGSPYITSRIMKLLINEGALPARPGEFTMRAFFNGKMDLAQSEAVADLVASHTSAAHRVAINQMRGGFSKEILNLRSELLRFASLIELELDFGEEDVQFADRIQLRSIVSKARNMSEDLLSSFSLGNAIKNGIPVVITGKPNSGKSTLLNALLNEDRAIVSDVPGTTRDTIEDVIVINGVEYRFIDTAGLRDTSDVVENLGILRTREKIEKASVVLLIDDVLDEVTLINQRAEEFRKTKSSGGQQLILIINKTDLSDREQIEKFRKNIILKESESLLFISAKEKKGLGKLRSALSEVVDRKMLASDNPVITNMRHYDSLRKVSESLERVISGLDENIAEDLIAIDIRHAIHYLGEITGSVITSDEILENIFKNFCIGK